MGMGEALGAVFAGAAGEYAGNRADEIRSEDKARLEQAREEKMMALQQRWQTSERVAAQEYGTKEREEEQVFKAGESEKDRELTRSEGAASRALTASEGAANRAAEDARAERKLAATAPKTGEDGEALFDKNWTKNEQGQWGRMDVYANGQQKWTAANKSMTDQLNNREAAIQTAGRPNQYEDALDAIIANPGALTSKVRALANTTEAGKALMQAKDILASSPEDKLVQQAYKLVEGARRVAGVGNAKEFGASGINTQAEAKDYMTAVPELDLSSEEALVSSAKKVKKYLQSNKVSEGMKLGVPREAFKYILDAEENEAKAAAKPKEQKNERPAYTPAHEQGKGNSWGGKYGY